VKINIKGVIVSNNEQWIYELFGIESVSPNMINDQLERANGEDLEVIINSGGGDVFAGSEIYTDLKEYQGNVTTKIVGIAASAASVIAMAGNKTLISPTAQIMVHNVSSVAWGDYRDLQHESDVLKNYNNSIANAYRIKSGMNQEELLELMNKETWYTAQQALEKNLVDEIMFENSQPKLVASAGLSQIIPQKVIDKMRNEFSSEKFKKPPENNEQDNERLQRNTRYSNMLKNLDLLSKEV
jgi:ATP-dependent Clp protease protease subunit